MSRILLVNKIKCKKCGDIIESTSRHCFRNCRCGEVCVDGGHDYRRRGAGNWDNIEDLCIEPEVSDVIMMENDKELIFEYNGVKYRFDKRDRDTCETLRRAYEFVPPSYLADGKWNE